MAPPIDPRSLSDEGVLQLRCVRCGHDLRSLSVKDDCPGCGVPVRTSIHVDRTEETGEKVCGRCGYDLRAVAGDRCPECGTPLAQALTRRGPAWEKALGWIEHVDTSCVQCGGEVADGRCVRCRTLAAAAAPRQGAGERPESRRLLDSFDAEAIELVRLVRRRCVLSALLVGLPVFASFVVAIAAGPSGGGGGGGPMVVRGLLSVVSVLAGPLIPLGPAAFVAVGAAALGFAGAGWLLTAPVDVAATASPLLRTGSRLRRVARLSALAWLPVPFFALASAVSPSTLSHAGFALAISFALLALSPLCAHLKVLASWIVDEKAEHFFNVGVWGALIAPLLPLGLLLFQMGGFVIVGVAGLAAAAAYYGATVGLLLLAASASWSVRHAEARIARDQRRLSAAAQRFAQDAERVRRTNPRGGT